MMLSSVRSPGICEQGLDKEGVLDLRPRRRSLFRLFVSILLSTVLVLVFLSSLWLGTTSKATHQVLDTYFNSHYKGKSGNNLESLSRPSSINSLSKHPTLLSQVVPFDDLKDYHEEPAETESCSNIYGIGFLKTFAKHRRNFCPETKNGGIECFRGMHEENGGDSFCVLKNVHFDPNAEKKVFTPSCRADLLTKAEIQEHPKLPQNPQDFFRHMFNTGPRIVLQSFFENITTVDDEKLKVSASTCQGNDDDITTILLKREDHEPNHPWHSLMEIVSLHATLDAMRLIPETQADEQQERPMWTLDAANKTQILLLDDRENGKLFDSYTMMAKMPVLRLADLKKEGRAPSCLGKVVLPLAGAASPLWKGNWDPRPCSSSRLMDVFVKRVMKLYEVKPRVFAKSDKKPLRLVFIDRKNRRRLRNQTEMLDKLQARYAGVVDVQTVDFWTLTFKEQIQLASQTDILVGVHGSMLANALYMGKEAAVVEIQPFNFWHYGFRNVARYKGNRYFRMHSEKTKENWQVAKEVIVAEDKFQHLMDAAIHSVMQRGSFSHDVIV